MAWKIENTASNLNNSVAKSDPERERRHKLKEEENIKVLVRRLAPSCFGEGRCGLGGRRTLGEAGKFLEKEKPSTSWRSSRTRWVHNINSRKREKLTTVKKADKHVKIKAKRLVITNEMGLPSALLGTKDRMP